jgi:transcriptional regulator NrdR family protein
MSARPRHACAFCPERFTTKEGVAAHERTVHRRLLDKLTAPAPSEQLNPIEFGPKEPV